MKQYESSVTSQWGEDGVIAEIFKRIGVKHHYCVEIGAWDGKHFSNTYALREKGWSGVLAEADQERAELIEPQEGVRIFGHCAHIDSMLDLYQAPTDFDLLSIDIDGDDYYLWQDMTRYRPRIVLIEYNQTVPPHISIIQHRGGSFGASFKSLVNLGKEKGYILAHATTTNLIFVNRHEWFKYYRSVYMPLDWVVFTVVGYSGKCYQVNEFAHNDDQGGKHEKLVTDIQYKPI